MILNKMIMFRQPTTVIGIFVVSDTTQLGNGNAKHNFGRYKGQRKRYVD